MSYTRLFPRTIEPARDDATITELMGRFVALAATDERPNSLTLRLPLLTIWSALHNLAGDSDSYWDATCLVFDLCDEGGDRARSLSPAGRTVADAFAIIRADLLAEEVPEPLYQPLMVGLIWADLCAATGDEPPPAVLALIEDAALAA